MGQTPGYALRYPASSDPPDVPTDMNKLALDSEAALNLMQKLAGKGVANGYASLDATGKVPAAQLPTAGAGTAGTEIGYDQITANVTVASATESAGTTIIACGAHSFDGAAAIAEFFSPCLLTANVAGATVIVSLFEGGTQIGRLLQSVTSTAVGLYFPIVGKLRFTPSAGSHTYTVTAFQAVSASSVILAGPGGVSAFLPAYIRFTKV